MIKSPKIATNLTAKDFYYDLPSELIAQTPLVERDSSKLLTLNRQTGEIEHKIFHDIIDYLNPNDVLVINDSKVIPARLYGKGVENNASIEVVLLKQLQTDVWEVMTRPGKKTKPGTKIIFGDGILCAEVLEIIEGGNRIINFNFDKSIYKNNFYGILDNIGNLPLPPYITEELKEKERYQTVYANEAGSAAAPTAGLHFTVELLQKIKDMGVKVAPVMLHVGLGTFRPVKVDNINEHIMHSEYFSISQESADIINTCKKTGGRVVAVGTTSCRTLESATDDNGIVKAMSDDTRIFIYPEYKFKVVDALITNFHLPESTLLMLISAFSTKDSIMNAYNVAIKEKYRFFSFGDAMYIY